MIRFKRYRNTIDAVKCIACQHEFDIKQLCKTGICPACQSDRAVGLQPDDDRFPLCTIKVSASCQKVLEYGIGTEPVPSGTVEEGDVLKCLQLQVALKYQRGIYILPP